MNFSSGFRNVGQESSKVFTLFRCAVTISPTHHLRVSIAGLPRMRKVFVSWGVASFEVGDEKWLYNRFCFFCLRFWILLLLSFLVPFALYLQQLGTRTSHFAWYLLHFGWSLCILHGTCYIWPCAPSVLHDICHIMALQLLICMVFATFWYFKRSCGFLESSSGFL